MQFQILKKHFIDKYIFFKLLGLIQNIFNIIKNCFKGSWTFYFNWRHSPKSLSSAETDLVEYRHLGINYCPAALGGRDNKKADFRQFLNSSKLSIVAAKSVQVMSPYTSNASDSRTVLKTLCSTPSGQQINNR
jgi:hypothetical protein